MADALAGLAAGLACLWLARDAALSSEGATRIVSGLLHNIYLAHDFRDEEREIYKTSLSSLAAARKLRATQLASPSASAIAGRSTTTSWSSTPT